MNKKSIRLLAACLVMLAGALNGCSPDNAPTEATHAGSGHAEPGYTELGEVLAPATGAEHFVLSSGSEGGGYWNAGERMRDVLEGMGVALENRGSGGSLDNLRQLMDPGNPVNLAFSQTDAAIRFFDGDVEKARAVQVIESIGMECVFLLTGADSPLRTDAELLSPSRSVTIGIASEYSGVAATAEHLASLHPDEGTLTTVFGDTLQAMTNFDTPDSTVDAVLVVHRPREHSPELDLALAEPDRFRVLPLTDERLLKATFDDQPVYRRMRLALPGAVEPVETICVSSLLFGHKQKLGLELRDRLAELVDLHWMRVFATE